MLEAMMREPGASRETTLTIQAHDDDDGGDVPPVLTDAQGGFVIAGLPHLRHEVVAEAQAGKLRGRAASVTPDATIAIQVAGVTTLAGTVTGPGGPVRQFTVELRGPTPVTRTFTDGRFQLGRIDPGEYAVAVRSSEGSADAQVTVREHQPASIDLTLARNAVIVGKLLDPDGKPIAGVGVMVAPDTRAGGMQLSRSGAPPTTLPDGSFRVETPAGPTMLIAATRPRMTIRRGLVTEAGQTLDIGALRAGAEP
jgi:hypothetical protein